MNKGGGNFYKMKILFYTGGEFLSDQRNGGQQVSFRNYYFLCQIFGTENVYVAIFCNEEVSDKVVNVKRFSKHRNKVEQYYNCIFMRNGYSKQVEREIVRYITELQPNIIFFDHTFTGGILRRLDKKIRKNMIIVSYAHNVVKRYVWEKVVHESVFFFIPYLSYYWNEKVLMNASDSIIALNQRDAKEIQEFYMRKVNYILPVTYQDKFDKRCLNRDKNDITTILFVGSYFEPNIQGIRWFIKNVLPCIKGKIRLEIVGKDMERLKGEWQSSLVEVIGTVDMTDSYYYHADLVVIPIPYGSGMKTKTAEAMMYGKYVIATKEALEGYDVEGLQYVKECNTDKEFIKEINLFFKIKNDNGFYPEVRECFLDKYENENVYKAFRDFMKETSLIKFKYEQGSGEDSDSWNY